MRVAQLTVCILSAFGLCAASARAEVLTLAELERKALENRPALARDVARTRAAAADLRRAASAYYPQFALKADTSIGPGRQLLQVGGDGSDDSGYFVQGSPGLKSGKNALIGYPRSGVELSASANLYDFGRTRAATDAGRESQAASLANRSLTEAEIRARVREGYVAWLLSSELYHLAESALAETMQRRERVEALIAEGVRPKSELPAARAEELLAKLEQERARRDLAASQLNLSQAVGTELAPDAEPDAQLFEANTQLPNRSAQHASQERALGQRYRAAKALVVAQARLNRPQLGIGASVGIRVSTQRVIDVMDPAGDRLDPPLRTTAFPLYTAGLTLNVPLWDGGFTRAGVEAAEAHAEEARADLEEYRQNSLFLQNEAQLDADSAVRRLQTAEELVTVCTARLKDAEDGYDLGASGIELIGQARSLLRRARTEALLARADNAAARLRLVSRADAR